MLHAWFRCNAAFAALHPTDFVCRERKVVVELDGGTHSSDAELAHDTRRTHHLEALGYRVFRISNDGVYHNLDCVLDELLAFLEAPR